MKILYNTLVAGLVFLAASSGITKIMLMPQDVEFFGEFGFSNPILIAFGALQLLGGILMAFPRSRLIGAITVAVTFLVSAVVLGVSGNSPMTIITLICVALLGYVIRQSIGSTQRASL